MQKVKNKTRILVECAIMIAAATVLSVVIIYEAPLGGSVTLFSMVPILALSFRHGIKWGCASAFVYSVLQLILGIGNVLWVPTARGIVLCVLFDYIIAFTILGFACIFRRLKTNEYMKILLGIILVCLLRYISHVISGAVVWYEITKEGQWNDLVNKFGMWTYSLIYNIQYMGPETVITLIAAPALHAVVNTIQKKKA
ncbi:MAG: energy-coupled thiamine transporter ThiT [Eubacteriales bacterium]|jgi:thiamine transporter|nr:energy-coupled thiamine transporter ThiT [Eubacteriales bacterium]